MAYDFAVIGGGFSGMTAALLLARHGRRTVLIEKNSRLAPLTRGFVRRGINFDTGFHYAGGLAEGEPLRLFLRYLRLENDLAFKPFAADGFDRLRFADGMAVSLPVGHEAITATLSRQFPAEQQAISTYLQRLDAAASTFPYINLDADFSALNSLSFVHGPSLRDVLDDLFVSERLKQVFSAHCILHGVPASDVPFPLHACFVGPYYHSAHGVAGGGAGLVAAFERALEQAGVDVVTGRGVVDLDIDAEGIRGLQLDDGERIAATGCVATMHPHALVDLVPDGYFRPSYKKRLKLLENSASALISYLACDNTPQWLARANLIVHNGNRNDGLDALLFIAGAQQLDDPQRVGGLVVIKPCTAELTRQWHHSRLGERPQEYLSFKQAEQRRLHQQLGALPDFDGPLEPLELATPLTLRDYSSNPGGGLYGVQHKVGQYNPQPVTKVPGLLLAGQAVAGPGLFGTMLSAFLACGAVLGHERLREDVKRCS